jgi:hypothetical protein
MTIQPGATLYTQAFGSRPEGVEVPHFDVRAPSTSDVNYPQGQRWINTVANNEYSLTSFTSIGGVVAAVWTLLGAGAGDLNTLTTQDATVVTPSAGNINLSGVGSLTTTGAGATATVALTGLTNHALLVGSGGTTITKLAVGATGTLLAGATAADPAFTASPSVSGSLTAGTTITATLGAITATNGNLVLGTAGNKILSTSVGTTTTAGANSFGSVTLVGGTATVATTAVTASSLIVLWRQTVGATGAAALGILSVGTISAGVSFVINAWQIANATALQASDVSVIGWMIIN